jgi:hypothetical protein
VLTVLRGIHMHFDRPGPRSAFPTEGNLNAQGTQGSLGSAQVAGELAWILWPAQVVSREGMTIEVCTGAKKV